MPKVKNIAKKESKCNQAENDALSTFNAHDRVIAYGNENKISRWMCLLNSGENINISFLKILAEIEENVLTRLNVLQSNIQNLISSKNDEFYESDNLKELKQLGIKLPIKDLMSFLRFDEELELDSQKRHALKCYMAKIIEAGETVNKDISNIMRNIMTANVEKHYSAYGRLFRGRRKLNYSETNAYLSMQDVLTVKYKKSANELMILPKVSRWLSQYESRLSGVSYRRRRCTKNTETEESSESSSE